MEVGAEVDTVEEAAAGGEGEATGVAAAVGEVTDPVVGQFDDGAVIESAVKYQRIAEKGLPRDSH